MNCLPKYACMATIEERQNALKSALLSLYSQVDHIYVYLNDYREPPSIPEITNVTYISALDTGIERGDAGKFYFLNQLPECIYFSVDDDLVYPQGYSDFLFRKLRDYGGNNIVTCHGRTLKPEARDYYRDYLDVFHFSKAVLKDRVIHFGGTGVMAFHTGSVKAKFEDFPSSNMADLWMGLYAQKKQHPIYILTHPSKWINMADIDVKKSIYHQRKFSRKDHNEVLKEMNGFFCSSIS